MRLPHRIQLVTLAETKDADFNIVKTWQAGPVIHARVQQTAAGEALQNQRELAKTVINVTVRYRTGITDDMRLIYNGDTYEIDGVVDKSGRRKQLAITATRHG